MSALLRLASTSIPCYTTPQPLACSVPSAAHLQKGLQAVRILVLPEEAHAAAVLAPPRAGAIVLAHP